MFGKLDGTLFSEIATKYKVTAFPTLMMFGGGYDLPVGYRGERTRGEIGGWIGKQVGYELGREGEK